ncbi:hypothetical protein GCM10009540_14320 [Streptomyces turgidiscabies]
MFGGDDGQVEADHTDGREQRETDPLAGAERPQRGAAAPADQRQEQQTGQAVAQELAARVRVVAEDAVGGEGAADEDGGQGGEKGPARGGDVGGAGDGVHAGDARQCGGPE